MIGHLARAQRRQEQTTNSILGNWRLRGASGLERSGELGGRMPLVCLPGPTLRAAQPRPVPSGRPLITLTGGATRCSLAPGTPLGCGDHGADSSSLPAAGQQAATTMKTSRELINFRPHCRCCFAASGRRGFSMGWHCWRPLGACSPAAKSSGAPFSWCLFAHCCSAPSRGSRQPADWNHCAPLAATGHLAPLEHHRRPRGCEQFN